MTVPLQIPVGLVLLVTLKLLIMSVSSARLTAVPVHQPLIVWIVLIINSVMDIIVWTTVQVGSGKTRSLRHVILARHPAKIVKIQPRHAQAVLSGSIYLVPHVNSVL